MRMCLEKVDAGQRGGCKGSDGAWGLLLAEQLEYFWGFWIEQWLSSYSAEHKLSWGQKGIGMKAHSVAMEIIPPEDEGGLGQDGCNEDEIERWVLLGSKF